MPMIGLGTWDIKTTEAIVNGVLHAGYRAIDTASWYKIEDKVGAKNML
jgi:diketogulonate reductase-like aldo/keto reductase